jgi:hypothetical protein
MNINSPIEGILDDFIESGSNPGAGATFQKSPINHYIIYTEFFKLLERLIWIFY